MAVQSFAFEWCTEDGITLQGHCWIPPQAKALVALVHGFGEHLRRYEHVANFLNQHYYGLIGFDQRGHGRSQGRRGHIVSYDDLLENIREMLALAIDKFDNLPLFLYGHSMGGNLVANYLIRYQPAYLKGAIITSPWLRLTRAPSFFLQAAVQLVYWLFPQASFAAQINPQHLSKDIAIQRLYATDPLVVRRMSVSMFTEVNRAGQFAIAHAEKINLPLLLMHGNDDQITSVQATEEFAKRLSSSKLTTYYWENMRHELHNEIEKEKPLKAITSWLEQQVQSVN